MRLFAVPPALRLIVVAAAAAIVAACSGGVNTTPVTQPGGGGSGVVTSTTSTVALPSIASSGVTFTGTLASASAAVLVSEQISTSPPSGVPALAATRTSQSKPLDTTSPVPNPIAYVTLTVPTTITIAAGSSVSFSLSQLTAGVAYYVAVNSGSGWQYPAAGPATVSGTTLTFSNLPSFTLTAGSPTTLALYSITASASASPTPTASPTASPTPAPTPVVSPASITFDITASPTPATVSVSENGYTGAFTSSIVCSASPAPSPVPTTNPFVAQVTPASATPVPVPSSTPAAAFSIVPGYETGTCTASFTDANNATVSIPVLNGSTSLNVYSSQRH